MFYKIFNLYSIMTFPKEDYKKIITNMKKSYAYLGYIDPSKKVGYENERYAKYLNLKQSMYTRKVPQVKGFYTTLDPNSNKYEPKDIEFSNTQPIERCTVKLSVSIPY